MDQLARIKTIELTADFSIKIMEADFTAEIFLSEKNALTEKSIHRENVLQKYR